MYYEFVRYQTTQVAGHLIVDEMKLKSGVFFHTKSHEVTGFATEGDGISLDEEIKHLFAESKNKKAENTKDVTSHVNQWRFRTYKNKVRNLEFYFNEGNTSRSEILRQLLHIVMCMSLIDVNVTGVSLDAGGNNRRFVRCIL